MFLLRALALCFSTTALVVAATSTSVAETATDRDPRHDVVRYSENGVKDVPRHANGDIVRHRIRYSDHRITSVIRFAELHHNAPVSWIGVPIMWPAGDGERGHGELEVEVRRSGPAQGKASFGGGDADCPVRSVIRYKLNRVRLSMPARCLDTPRWIRAWVGAYTQFSSHTMFDTSPNDPTGKPGMRITRG